MAVSAALPVAVAALNDLKKYPAQFILQFSKKSQARKSYKLLLYVRRRKLEEIGASINLYIFILQNKYFV